MDANIPWNNLCTTYTILTLFVPNRTYCVIKCPVHTLQKPIICTHAQCIHIGYTLMCSDIVRHDAYPTICEHWHWAQYIYSIHFKVCTDFVTRACCFICSIHLYVFDLTETLWIYKNFTFTIFTLKRHQIYCCQKSLLLLWAHDKIVSILKSKENG